MFNRSSNKALADYFLQTYIHTYICTILFMPHFLVFKTVPYYTAVCRFHAFDTYVYVCTYCKKVTTKLYVKWQGRKCWAQPYLHQKASSSPTPPSLAVSIRNPLTFFLVFKSLTLPDPFQHTTPFLFFSCCISSSLPWGNKCWWMWNTLPTWILAHKKIHTSKRVQLVHTTQL